MDWKNTAPSAGRIVALRQPWHCALRPFAGAICTNIFICCPQQSHHSTVLYLVPLSPAIVFWQNTMEFNSYETVASTSWRFRRGMARLGVLSGNARQTNSFVCVDGIGELFRLQCELIGCHPEWIHKNEQISG